MALAISTKHLAGDNYNTTDILFADDNVLHCSEDMNGELERWRKALEDRRMKVNRNQSFHCWRFLTCVDMFGVRVIPCQITQNNRKLKRPSHILMKLGIHVVCEPTAPNQKI